MSNNKTLYRGWLIKQLFPENFMRQQVAGKDREPRQKKNESNDNDKSMKSTTGYEDTWFSDFHFTQWKLIHDMTEPEKRRAAAATKAENKWWRMWYNFSRACKLAYLHYTDLPLSANYLRVLATKVDAIGTRPLTDGSSIDAIPPMRIRDRISLFGSLLGVTLTGILMWPVTMLKEGFTAAVLAPLRFFVINPLYHAIYIPLSGFTSLDSPWDDFARDAINIVKHDVVLPLYRIYSNTIALLWDVPISVIIGLKAYALSLSFPTKYNQENNVKFVKQDSVSTPGGVFSKRTVHNILQLLMGSKNVFLPLWFRERRDTKHSKSSTETESLLSKHRSDSNISDTSALSPKSNTGNKRKA